MVRFLQQCTIFALIFIPVFFIYSLINIYSYTPYIFKNDIKTLITGDSHVQTAINSDLLEHTENVSLNSEGYIYSYYKLSKILETNTQIENVMLGFSYHNLSSYYDDYMIGEHAGAIFPRYIELLNLNEIFHFVKKYPEMLIPTLSNLLSINRSKYQYIGKFENDFQQKLEPTGDAIKNRILLQYYIKDSLRGFSEINIEYFLKIMQLCKQRNVKLYLINTPLHEAYFNKIPKKFINKYRQLIDDNDLTVIDFKSLNLADGHFLPDGDHLNQLGASLAIIYFKKKMDNLQI